MLTGHALGRREAFRRVPLGVPRSPGAARGRGGRTPGSGASRTLSATDELDTARDAPDRPGSVRLTLVRDLAFVGVLDGRARHARRARDAGRPRRRPSQPGRPTSWPFSCERNQRCSSSLVEDLRRLTLAPQIGRDRGDGGLEHLGQPAVARRRTRAPAARPRSRARRGSSQGRSAAVAPGFPGRSGR